MKLTLVVSIRADGVCQRKPSLLEERENYIEFSIPAQLQQKFNPEAVIRFIRSLLQSDFPESLEIILIDVSQELEKMFRAVFVGENESITSIKSQD